MKKLRKFSVLLLFAAFFGALVFSAFSGALSDMAENLRSGRGAGECLWAAQGADGKTYAVMEQNGARTLYGLEGAERKSRKSLSSGLPESYGIQSLFVAADGTVLLSVYALDGVLPQSYGLYASRENGPFVLLYQAELSGTTADQRRQSAGLTAARQEGNSVALTLCKAGKQEQYSYDPADGQGLIARPLENIERDAAQPDAVEEAWSLVLAAGIAPETVTSLSPAKDGEALAVLNGKQLYLLVEGAEKADLSAGLYRRPWQSALLLAAVVLGVLALAYGCYYAVCEVKQLYFPLGLRTLLWLLLAGYAAVCLLTGLGVSPAQRNSVRQEAQTALKSQAALAAESTEKAAQALAQASPAWADSAFFLLEKRENGWQLASTADGETGEKAAESAQLLRAAAAQNWTAQEPLAFPTLLRGEPNECVLVPLEESRAALGRMNVSALEERAESGLKKLRLWCGVAAAALALGAAGFSAGAARGARRVTKGIDLLSAKTGHVRVNNPSGDELEALGAAFNDLSAQQDEWNRESQQKNNAYLRFVPRRFVALLGTKRIEQLDKTATASHEMAVMAVRFTFPQEAEHADAQQLFDNINEVFEHISAPVSEADGAIYNFDHDGFDAVFENGARAAVGAAVAVRQALLDLNAERAARGEGSVQLRVTLDHGAVMLGVVGDGDRVVPTVVSACLNRARRLAVLAERLDAGILCTAAAADAAKEYALRYIGKTAQRDGGFRVYEIFDGDPYSVRQAKESLREPFSSGLYALYGGKFSEAKRLFMDIVRRQDQDGAARYYLYLADRCEKDPPEEISLG